MAEGGRCVVDCMPSTIVYSVDHEKAKKAETYELKVLTVVTKTQVKDKNLMCKIGEHEGVAGHVLLKFPKGGHILTSMGHWVELMKIDTSEHKLFEIARRDYGEEYAQEMEQEYNSLDVGSRKEYVSKKAVNFVQNQAPCKNMASKAMKKKY